MVEQALPLIGDVIEMVPGGCLAGVVPWAEDDVVLQTVRASPEVYKMPQFDSVRINRGAGQVGFAQLRLLFRATITLALGEPEQMSFAFVRWYRSAPNAYATLRAAGCDKLQWDTFHRQPQYSVEPLESLLCRECVVPAFGSLSTVNADSVGKAEMFYRSVPN